MTWDTSDSYGIDLQADVAKAPLKFREARRKAAYVAKPDDLCSVCGRWRGVSPKKGRCDTCYRRWRANGRDTPPMGADSRRRP